MSEGTATTAPGARWAALRRLGIEHVFLVVALCWGVAQALLVPPLQVPDEGDHWFRAWAVTEGQLTADGHGMLTLPGSFRKTVDLYTSLVSDTEILPPSLRGQPGFAGYADLFEGAPSPSPVRVQSRVLNYGPVGYVPQALGIAVGRLLAAPPLVCFYLARIANLLAAVALLFLAIRLVPWAKHLVAFVALLPMSMFELASVSCDALTIAGTILFICLVLWLTTRQRLTRMEIAVTLAAAALLLNLKPGYWALVLLLLLLKPSQLGGRRQYAAFVAGNIAAVALTFLVIQRWTATDMPQTAVAHARMLFVIQQPLAFLGVVAANVRENLVMWMLQSIGVLGWIDVLLPPLLYALILASGLVFLVMVGDNGDVRIPGRLLIAGVGGALFVTLAAALYVFLPLSPDGWIAFQGRYLVPLWLVAFLSVYGVPRVRRKSALPVVTALFLVVMAVDLQAIVSFYS